MEPWQWLVATMAGAVGQFLDSMAGMGFGALSGSVMLAGGIAPAVVVGTVSLAKIGSGCFSGLAHWRADNVRPRWVVQIAVPGMLGGVTSAYLLTGLPTETVRIWVPVVLFVMGLLLLRRFLLSAWGLPRFAGGSGAANGEAVRPRPLPTFPPVSLGAWLVGTGFIAGFVNGISGAFGPVATTAVALRMQGHPRYAIGSVNVAEVFVALAVSATILTRMSWEVIGWQLPVALVVGSLFTAPLGAYLASHLPARGVGIMLGLVLLGLNGTGFVRAIT
jgi:uncharacterized membrane protein YfcA